MFFNDDFHAFTLPAAGANSRSTVPFTKNPRPCFARAGVEFFVGAGLRPLLQTY
jgi:hypothetical protein